MSKWTSLLYTLAAFSTTQHVICIAGLYVMYMQLLDTVLCDSFCLRSQILHQTLKNLARRKRLIKMIKRAQITWMMILSWKTYYPMMVVNCLGQLQSPVDNSGPRSFWLGLYTLSLSGSKNYISDNAIEQLLKFVQQILFCVGTFVKLWVCLPMALLPRKHQLHPRFVTPTHPKKEQQRTHLRLLWWTWLLRESNHSIHWRTIRSCPVAYQRAGRNQPQTFLREM